ncbi:protein Son isoform X2 [Centruroides vittatus]|uniref:protein Son isoform X2 n=1 Tax=Centruroides vittatus TaxID=120091 RepID=UPI00350FFA9D
MMKDTENTNSPLQVGDILAEFFAKKMDQMTDIKTNVETNENSSSNDSKYSYVEKKKKRERKSKKRKHKHKRSRKKKSKHSSESHRKHKSRKRKHSDQNEEKHSNKRSKLDISDSDNLTKANSSCVTNVSDTSKTVSSSKSDQVPVTQTISKEVDISEQKKDNDCVKSKTSDLTKTNNLNNGDINLSETANIQNKVEKSKLSSDHLNIINTILMDSINSNNSMIKKEKEDNDIKPKALKEKQAIVSLDYFNSSSSDDKTEEEISNLKEEKSNDTSKKTVEDSKIQSETIEKNSKSVEESSLSDVKKTNNVNEKSKEDSKQTSSKSKGKIVIKDLKSIQIPHKLEQEKPEKVDSLEEGEITSNTEKTSLSCSFEESSGEISDTPKEKKVKKKKEKYRHKKKKKKVSKKHRRSRSKSQDKERHHSSRHHERKSSKTVKRSRSRSPSPSRKRPYDAREKIDKARLLQVAQKNVLMMLEKGTLPKGFNIDSIRPEQRVSLKTGGKSVQELTDFCRAISQRDQEDNSSNGSQDKQSDIDTPFIHHPFKLKEHQPVIKLNIKNAVQLPVKTPAEKVADAARLRTQFPVSSGSQHRLKELQWVPVEEDSKSSTKSSKSSPANTVSVIESQTEVVSTPPEPEEPPPPPPPLPPPAPVISTFAPAVQSTSFFESVSQNTSMHDMDLSAIVSQRLKAIRKLQENPNDVEALNQMFQSQQKMQAWVQSKQLPGQYTGSTDIRLLSPEELTGPVPVWVKKDQFSRAMPVREGIGMHLLRKMGWNPGEGLGKNKEGVLEPLLLDIKTDKRGLKSDDDISKKVPPQPIAKDLSGKHPVSALMELCSKRKWGAPEFQLIDENGPDHRKTFLFRVRINGVVYQPTCSSPNKKHAKAQAAAVCLQSLGLLPRDLNNPL